MQECELSIITIEIKSSETYLDLPYTIQGWNSMIFMMILNQK